MAVTIPAKGKTTRPELDVQILHSLPSEQQDLYLLTFTAELAHYVANLGSDETLGEQPHVKKEIFQVINLSSPAPTKIIRNNLGKAFAALFEKGDRKILFESINELVAIVNAGKGGGELKAKHAAVHCLGTVYEAAGASAISLTNLTSTSLLRLLKSAQHHAGFRSSIYKTLGMIVNAVRNSIDENIARDVFKQARSAISADVSLLVQTNACGCLEQLIQGTHYFDNSNDFDRVRTVIGKNLESPSPAVRHAAASCFSAALCKSFSESPTKDAVVTIRKPKKATKKPPAADDKDDEMSPRSSSPAPQQISVKLSFTLLEILRQLSTQYCRFATNTKGRAGIALCYVLSLQRLGRKIVGSSYAAIANHLFQEILNHRDITTNRYRLLLARKHIRIILEKVIGRQMLGEAGQLDASRFLINDIIKNYPQALKERPEPGKQTLVGALSALRSLTCDLGTAMSILSDAMREGLLQVLQHPSYTVQIRTSYCLQALARSCPQQLLPIATSCLDNVSRELTLLGGPRTCQRKCVAYATGLAAVLSVAPTRPLYGSVDVYSRVLSQATILLKSSGSLDIKLSSTQIQVAWTLISSLMPLGPNFVKLHLPQLLLLWRNALPKPLTKDHIAQRNLLELSFLAHVRECALGSMLTFLQHNKRLLTLDVCKRLATMLQNTTTFLSSLPSKKVTDDISLKLTPSLQLQDFETMVRRRIFQCYFKLVTSGPTIGSDNLVESSVLPLTLAAFADPEDHGQSSLSAAIASSIGTFESIWEVEELYGERNSQSPTHWSSHNGAEGELDRSVLSPILGAEEHDSVSLCMSTGPEIYKPPDPPSIEAANSAINLFAVTLPLQPPKVQESILEQMSTFLSAESLATNPARRAAILVNAAAALLATLKVATGETQSNSGNLRAAPVEKALQEQLNLMITSSDHAVRYLAAEAIGRLCSYSNSTFAMKEINQLIDMIVSNRDPNVRAGCAFALGAIHTQLGGMAASYHLNTVHSVLMSLASDPHPTVHYWALAAVSRVADSAGLAFSGQVPSTLGMLAQVYVLDTHNEEAASTASSNLELDSFTTTAIAHCVDSLINVLGPDIQDNAKTRGMILTLVAQFEAESKPSTIMEGLKCLDHLFLYDPGRMAFERYVRLLQRYLESGNRTIRNTILDGFQNLMRRDAEDVFAAANPGLEDTFWLLLDDDPRQSTMKNIMRIWLQQTWASNTDTWVKRCFSIMTRTKSRNTESTVRIDEAHDPNLQDEEVTGFNTAAGGDGDDQATLPNSGQQLLRWQVRAFAMECLSDVITMVAKDASIKDESPAEIALQKRIADIIRILFSASTASVLQLRISGMRIIDQVLKLFGSTPDPDFAEVSLLEQYQAQISSALTPAFAADSSPELAAEAVNVCATFISTGIVTDVDRMGRILKLLVAALDSFSNNKEAAGIGDLKNLSPNAQVMVKMSVYSAWAELQIASVEQKYLEDVVKPHIAKLTPLWLSSLREYARLKYEPETSMTSNYQSLANSADTLYAALNRETLLKFYHKSWLRLVDAIATLIDQDSEFVYDALDGKLEPQAPNGTSDKAHDINYRDEPVAFFFVLFGVSFEALINSLNKDSPAARERTLAILSALRKILRPSVSGNAIYQPVVFSETMDLLDRLVLTEGLDVQAIVVEIARNLCLAHPSGKDDQAEGDDEHLSDDIDQLFELTRIIALVLAGLVPNLTESKSQRKLDLKEAIGLADATPNVVRHPMSDEAVNIIIMSLNALVDTAVVFPGIIRTDLNTCILHIFATILGTSACQEKVVPQALPILRRFIKAISADPQSDSFHQIRSTLSRFLSILKAAQKRESDSSLPCEKNTLLACTILLTSSSSSISPSDPLLHRFVAELLEELGDALTAKVAASCARSLLVVSKRGQTEEAIAALLLPRLIAFLTTPPDTEGLEEARSVIALALTSFVSTVAREQQTAAMALVMPALLARARNEGEAVYRETAARILDVAGANQIAFRSVMAGMAAEQRTFLEDVVRVGGGGGERDKSEEMGTGAAEPSIALRMDFG